MRTRWIGMLATMSVSVLAGGCLVFDRVDTVYLEPGGPVTWSVMHKDVRSDAASAPERQDEEVPYLLGVQAQNHDLARGFWQLTPLDVRTRILRAIAPFTVTTEARFPSLAVLGQRLIDRFGLEGTSRLESGPDGTRWTLTVRESASPNGGTDDDVELEALVPDLDHLVIVLVSGRFVDAQGFSVSNDGRVARFVDDPSFEAKIESGAEIVVSLTWR
jgi:hypothetical protein